MAEPALDLLDEQLTCSVCLDQYTNPKTLPCHHSFCLKCIELLPVEKREKGYCITCPSCRENSQLPQNGARGLPIAFHINSLLDVRKRLGSYQKEDEKCPKHNDSLKVYCETCREVICRDCTISQEHNAHRFELIADCYPKHHKQIEASLKLVKDKIRSVNTAVGGLVTREEEIVKQGEKIKEEICTYAQQLINQVKASEKQLLQQVDRAVKQKSFVLNKQKEEAKKCLDQLEASETAVEMCLQELSERQILMKKEEMKTELKVACELTSDVFQAIETANMKFKRNDTINMKVGSLATKTLKEAIVQLKPHMAISSLSTATLTLQSHDSSLFSLPLSFISCRLTSAGDSQPINCDISQTQPGKYIVNFTPRTRGEFQLKVQVGGINVSGSPFTFAVLPSAPETRGTPVMTITGLNRPIGIAVCDNGDIVVVEQGAHCISVLKKNGEKVRSFGTWGTKEGQFTFPSGIAVSEDHIFAVDNHRIQKLTMKGVFVKSVGSSEAGIGDHQFDHPTDVTLHQASGLLFVADSNNNRIQIFDKDLAHVDTIASGGKRFSCPCNIAFDSKGSLYIVEWGKRGVSKLTATGSYVPMIESVNPGQYFQPSSTTVDKNLMYITDCGGHQICIYDTTSGALKHWFGRRGSGEGELESPSSITVDKLGNLYVSDTYNNRVVVF